MFWPWCRHYQGPQGPFPPKPHGRAATAHGRWNGRVQHQLPHDQTLRRIPVLYQRNLLAAECSNIRIFYTCKQLNILAAVFSVTCSRENILSGDRFDTSSRWRNVLTLSFGRTLWQRQYSNVINHTSRPVECLSTIHLCNILTAELVTQRRPDVPFRR